MENRENQLIPVEWPINAKKKKKTKCELGQRFEFFSRSLQIILQRFHEKIDRKLYHQNNLWANTHENIKI